MTHTSISDTLHNLLDDADEQEHITVGRIVTHLDGRVYGFAWLLLALPNLLPIPSPPGLSGVTGIPIILLGLQAACGCQNLWLPQRLRQAHLSVEWLRRLFAKAMPVLHKLEKLLHPRAPMFASLMMLRACGLVIIYLGVLLSLPLPFGNILPSLPIALMALGTIERDGACIALGLLLGVAIALGMSVFWFSVIVKLLTLAV